MAHSKPGKSIKEIGERRAQKIVQHPGVQDDFCLIRLKNKTKADLIKFLDV